MGAAVSAGNRRRNHSGRESGGNSLGQGIGDIDGGEIGQGIDGS